MRASELTHSLRNEAHDRSGRLAMAYGMTEASPREMSSMYTPGSWMLESDRNAKRRRI
jgi:hypothetical protein